MTLALYEDALAVLQDHLPDWWAKEFRDDSLDSVLLYENLEHDPQVRAASRWGTVQTAGFTILAGNQTYGATLPAAAQSKQKGFRVHVQHAADTTAMTSGVISPASSLAIPSAPGKTYTVIAEFYVDSVSPAASWAARIDCVSRDAAFAQAGSQSGTLITTNPGWTRIVQTYTTAPNTAWLLVNPEFRSAVNAATIDGYITRVLVLEGDLSAKPPSYFDPDSTPYAVWTGGAHDSTSRLYDKNQTGLVAVNELVNPSIEGTAFPWTFATSGGVTATFTPQDSSWAARGTFSCRLQVTAATGPSLTCVVTAGNNAARMVPVSPGEAISAKAKANVANQGDGGGTRVQIVWRDASTAPITTVSGTFVPGTGIVEPKLENVIAPDNAAYAELRVGGTCGPAALMDFQVDEAILVRGPTVSGYFDGDSDPSFTRWTGDPHASTSELYERDLTPAPQSNLYVLLAALAEQIDELSGGLEDIHSDMALVTATLDGLRAEYAYAFGVENEQLPPTVDGLRHYIQTWASTNGSTQSVVALLTSLLQTDINTIGTVLVFDAGGAGLTFPAPGNGLTMFQTVGIVANLTFPTDDSGIPIDTTIPNASGWVIVNEFAATYTWEVQVKSYLNFDRQAFARAVERLRQAHLLPATITEVNT